MYISPQMHVTRIPAVLITRISFEFSCSISHMLPGLKIKCQVPGIEWEDSGISRSTTSLPSLFLFLLLSLMSFS